MRFGIYQEVAVLLVVDQRLGLGIVVCRVTYFVFVDPEIVMEEHSNFASRIVQVSDADAAEEDVVVACHGIVAADPKSEPGIFKPHIGDERFVKIREFALPIVGEYPRKGSFGPHSESERESLRVIFLSDVRKIDITNLVFSVEVDQQ